MILPFFLSVATLQQLPKDANNVRRDLPLFIDESLTIYPSSYAPFVDKEATYAHVFFAKLLHHA